jgi:hypothetical protein
MKSARTVQVGHASGAVDRVEDQTHALVKFRADAARPPGEEELFERSPVMAIWIGYPSGMLKCQRFQLSPEPCRSHVAADPDDDWVLLRCPAFDRTVTLT